ncbi:cobalt-precorrin-6A reductase [Pseudooceanicola sp. CBS1P-1]|uniref:Cobalt-precorrin-6A reductase n=1 Tax=Pseudooceanicola albus TaxID=2692189 RepID=A0A6L7GBH4_9RHOB|nr:MULTISPECIES: cobalt-precorrin-6A reductase [Pseudooceanicola]MBT9384285.1 cobalt-precorrin-6A reductase [Pseudooceanicola endophyticus]MXN20878.1 cobalt-precorrin-6A reductase [Pseudooceanicola albus]
MILLLGGTAEARVLGGKLAEAGRPAVVSLAGAVLRPAPQPLPTRIGGFGGDAGFAAYLMSERISAVLDATHPFAARITARAARICGDLGLPYARLSRPGWQEGPGDHWHRIDRAEEAARIIPETAHVFLASGRLGLAAFAGLAGRQLTVRVVEDRGDPFPHPNGRWLVARPPFTQAAEVALFRDLGIDWIVAKESGGSGRAKLDAARQLGLGVVLLNRPPEPPGVPLFRDVESALHWLEALP